MKKIVFDFDPQKYNRYTFYRAIMENTALVTYGHMKLVEETTGNVPDEVVFAGGASKSDLWCQILCDVLGKPVNDKAPQPSTAPLGKPIEDKKQLTEKLSDALDALLHHSADTTEK